MRPYIGTWCCRERRPGLYMVRPCRRHTCTGHRRHHRRWACRLQVHRDKETKAVHFCLVYALFVTAASSPCACAALAAWQRGDTKSARQPVLRLPPCETHLGSPCWQYTCTHPAQHTCWQCRLSCRDWWCSRRLPYTPHRCHRCLCTVWARGFYEVVRDDMQQV